MDEATCRKVIQRRFKDNQPLNLSLMLKEYQKIVEFAFAGEKPIGWYGLLQMSEVDPYSIEHELEPYLECKICGKSYQSLPRHLKIQHSLSGDEYREVFGNDLELVSEAHRARMRCQEETELKHWEKAYSKLYVLDRIIQWRQLGKDLNYHSIYGIDIQLTGQALLLWGSWDNALRHVHEHPSIHKKLQHSSWTKVKVISELKSLNGRPMGNILSSAARRYFGSAQKAIQAAGVDRSEIGGSVAYSEDEIGACLATAREASKLLGRERVLAIRELYSDHKSIIQNRYGSLGKMAKATGIEPLDLSYRNFRDHRDIEHELNILGHPSMSYLYHNDQLLWHAVRKLQSE